MFRAEGQPQAVRTKLVFYHLPCKLYLHRALPHLLVFKGWKAGLAGGQRSSGRTVFHTAPGDPLPPGRPWDKPSPCLPHILDLLSHLLVEGTHDGGSDLPGSQLVEALRFALGLRKASPHRLCCPPSCPPPTSKKHKHVGGPLASLERSVSFPGGFSGADQGALGMWFPLPAMTLIIRVHRR